MKDKMKDRMKNLDPKNCITTFFTTQLDNLMDILGATEPRYIRCIKSNHYKTPYVFDSYESYRQLKCSGVLEAVKIRSSGYKNRINFIGFIKN